MIYSFKESRYNKFFFQDGSIFLFNFFSRACIKINHSELEKVRNILTVKHPSEGENKNHQDILIKNGFVIFDEIDELEVLEYLFHANYFRTDEINIVLVPTLQCNFKCPYCFEAGHREENIETKDYFTVLKKFADSNFKNKKRVHITLFGGEPLLKRNEIFSFLGYLSEQSGVSGYNLSTNLVTNGFLLDENTVRTLLNYDCISIQITIDGSKETHNKLRVLHNDGETFDTIINNFKNAVHQGINSHSNARFILRVNLLNQNVDDIESIFPLFTKEEREKINIIFRPIYITTNFDEPNSISIFNLKIFYDIAKKYGFNIIKSTYFLQHCESEGDINFFYITPDLQMWKCINNLSVKVANIGYIEETGNMQLNSIPIATWYQKSNPFKDEKCRNCQHLPICYGGCILHYIKTGKRKCISEDMSIVPYFYS